MNPFESEKAHYVSSITANDEEFGFSPIEFILSPLEEHIQIEDKISEKPGEEGLNKNKNHVSEYENSESENPIEENDEADEIREESQIYDIIDSPEPANESSPDEYTGISKLDKENNSNDKAKHTNESDGDISGSERSSSSIHNLTKCSDKGYRQSEASDVSRHSLTYGKNSSTLGNGTDDIRPSSSSFGQVDYFNKSPEI